MVKYVPEPKGFREGPKEILRAQGHFLLYIST